MGDRNFLVLVTGFVIIALLIAGYNIQHDNNQTTIRKELITVCAHNSDPATCVANLKKAVNF